MDRMLYIAMSGAKETMLAQQVNSHNLANSNTSGFRADIEAMQQKPIYGPGLPDRAYALSQDLKTMDFAPGALETTGRELDVAVNGEGWIAVQSEDGSEGLTRRGDLKVSADGLLLNGEDLPVLGNSGPITLPPFEKLEIGIDGTISIRGVGQPVNTLAVIDRIKLVIPDNKDLEKDESGQVRMRNGQQTVADAKVQLASGVLEKSNVNSIEGMVRMMELQRHYELQVKMMDTAKTTSESTQQLMRMR
ncbi:MAG: flagellar basal body rod protein FlgF [bacterium]